GKDNQLILMPEISVPLTLTASQTISAPLYIDSGTTAGTANTWLSQKFAGVLTTALVVGTTYNSLAVSAGTKINIPIHTLFLGSQGDVPVYCTANTAAGSTSIPTNSFTCITAFGAGQNLLAQYPFIT